MQMTGMNFQTRSRALL
ncbi:hypothetical protein [uncultured Robinsoniella sp.]